MKKFWLVMSALGFSAAAMAQSTLPSFEEVDANADGQISMEEAAAIEGLDFATADANQDGALDQEEYAALQGQ
jgi:EF hand